MRGCINSLPLGPFRDMPPLPHRASPWKTEHASRAAVLIDGARFFGAVRESLIKAQHCITIAGWDIDSRMRLVGESCDADDGYPLALSDFLSALVERRPQLTVRLLLWDYSILYALERELFPRYSLNWATPDQVQLCLDNEVPFGCSQHQKIIVVDDRVAFSGGLDLAVRRWDTSQHLADNPLRVDPAGNPYPPFHDVQAVVEGEAARALSAIVNERWQRTAKCQPAPPVTRDTDAWPQSITADFTDIRIGICRTLPPSDDRPGVHEIEATLQNEIRAAERFIYIENQFLTSEKIAYCLAKKLREKENLELLMVAPKTPENWIEAKTMRNGRIRFKRILQNAGCGERWRLVYPEVASAAGKTATMVHSKVMIVDDRTLRVGSANLNNRSMGADSECDLVIEGTRGGEREAIRDIRDRLLADHCGTTAQAVRAMLRETNSLIAVADNLSRNGHRLRRIDDGAADRGDFVEYIEAIADPKGPLNMSLLVTQMRGALAGKSMLVTLFVAFAAIAGLIAAWQYSPLAQWAQPDQVRGLLNSVSESPWAPAMVIGLFLAAGMVAFPLTLLIAGTAAVFGPVNGFLFAAVGAMGSAMLTYAIGALIGREQLRRWLGPRLTRIRARLVKHGVMAVAAIRLVPIAPFTIVNFAAGATGIRVFDFTIGTFLGLLPGLLTISLLGHQIFRVLTSPTPLEITVLALGILGWLGLSYAAQTVISRYS